MGALIHDLIDKGQINAQFQPGTNIHKTLALFKRLYNNGTYQFGTLTAAYNDWPPGSEKYESWIGEVNQFYDQGAQDKIKACIIEALTHRKNGTEDPLQVKINWASGPKDVTSSYDPATHTYTINITGYKEP
jgi:hypothetical protein